MKGHERAPVKAPLLVVQTRIYLNLKLKGVLDLIKGYAMHLAPYAADKASWGGNRMHLLL